MMSARPETSVRAAEFGRYPSERAIIVTLARTSGATLARPLRAREAVALDTPLVRATSSSVTARDRAATFPRSP